MATATRPLIDLTEADARPMPEGWHRTILDLSPEAYECVEKLLEETHLSPSDLLSKALGLFTLALKARREGKIVGAAGDDQEIDTEFVGF